MVLFQVRFAARKKSSPSREQSASARTGTVQSQQRLTGRCYPVDVNFAVLGRDNRPERAFASDTVRGQEEERELHDK